MGNIRKSLAIILTAMMALSCLSLSIIKPANAQTIPKPSVPEFTIKNVADDGLQIEIQNQPYIPNGHALSGIFYDFRYKWHESTTWHHPEPDPSKWYRQYIAESGPTSVTTLVDSINSFYERLGDTSSHQLDVQVRVINGYQNTSYPWVPPIGIEPGDNPIIIVNTSDWSNTQTVTLGSNILVQPTYNPSSTPSQTANQPTTTASTIGSVGSLGTDWQQTVLILMAIVIAVLAVAVFLLAGKHRKTANLKQ
jgi:hypothetical protein